MEKQKAQQELQEILMEAYDQHDLEVAERLLGWLVLPSEIAYEKIIGRGAFGEVWLAQWKGVDVAVKKMYPPVEDAAVVCQPTDGSRHHKSSSQKDASDDSPISIDPAALVMLQNLEVDVMMKLRHPRIVAFLGAGEIVDPVLPGETNQSEVSLLC